MNKDKDCLIIIKIPGLRPADEYKETLGSSHSPFTILLIEDSEIQSSETTIIYDKAKYVLEKL